MFRFQAKRVEARKILLDKRDVIAFRNVPHFIVDSFFGECSYYKRMIVCAFSYLNGISFFQLKLLIRWKRFLNKHEKQMEALLTDFQKPHYQEKYYSYNVHYGLVMFLNGKVRKHRRR